MEFNYEPKPNIKLKADFNRRKSNGQNSFSDFEAFMLWYSQQEKKCFYCNLKEAETQEIVKKGILTSNRFPLNGDFERGKSRGYWLEVDRINPKANYSTENCVLCCYFCNNDKSDVFHGGEYKKFMENRAEYLRILIKEYNLKLL